VVLHVVIEAREVEALKHSPRGHLAAESTSFIGRRSELAEIKRKLTQARLVSLVGPGD